MNLLLQKVTTIDTKDTHLTVYYNLYPLLQWCNHYSKKIEKVKCFVVFDGKHQLLRRNYGDNFMLTTTRDCGGRAGKTTRYGVNDSKEDAKALSKLLKGRQCHINLIPVNEIKENTMKRPSKKTIEEFEKIVSDYGLDVTVRKEMGNDINAACGQLRKQNLNK